MKRKIALEKIKIDYAMNGKDTGDATRAMIEGRISRQKYNQQAIKGLSIFNKQSL